ncbi:hypothetical protein EXE44_15955 [Halorubrum sp. SS7]|uniref:hypothetical protein n=1 Tax=unclassified Halorubrum TaxID=2642239 RepID=UPI0010F457CE|nr:MULTISPECIES: hypothetical protein [unclassified Halorubrum]TKX54500.1 hypothetical protein EXE42_08410 [Halorubrum sp. SP3]TKX55951.1 hypothetical protein EXE44_15955 [Halorubrum sp. SS7]TKX61472.1 hypothetical protein EXE45_17155 [Halorubrum sp. SP9]
MGSSTEGSDGQTTVSTHVTEEFVEEFDRALKMAQIEGDISMDVSRAEALRRLMKKGIEDPSLFAETNQE